MSTTTLDNLLASLGEISDVDIDTWIEKFKYKGIDIQGILDTITVITGQSSSKKKNLNMLIVVGLCRGNAHSKILKSMYQDHRSKFTEAIKEFGIRESVSNSAYKATVLSLARLRIAAPTYAASALRNERLSRLVEWSGFKRGVIDYTRSRRVGEGLVIILVYE